MILADKIINERKKLGWSQEELADKLGVSRQSVSKWEGAQSVPDLQRILEMSQIFGVSTDYLLKDDIEAVVPTESSDDTGKATRTLSLEEANTYLTTVSDNSSKIALGAAICVSCAVPLLLVAGGQMGGVLPISEAAANAIGVTGLFLLVAISLIFFIPAGIMLSKWQWLEEEVFETAYGVDGAVRARSEKFTPKFAMGITGGVVSILIGVTALLATAFLSNENESVCMAAAAVLLLFISAGVFMIIRAGMIKDSYKKILQEEDYSKSRKQNKLLQVVAPAYWMIVTAGYLAWSFITFNWGYTWIVWPVAGVLFGAIAVVLDQVGKKEE